MIDGAGVIDGGGQRWWEVRAAQQAGDRNAAEFLSKTRHGVSARRNAACTAADHSKHEALVPRIAT